MERPIVEINGELCNGCGKCILDCAEGALALVDGKAKLISDTYCDGFGACLNCPQGAITLRTREARPFDEAAAQAAKARQPGLKSQLRNWPIQLELMPAKATYYANADIVLAAHCAGFALPELSSGWLCSHLPIIACPKLANRDRLTERLVAILAANEIRSLTVFRMSVPCCCLDRLATEALAAANRQISWRAQIIHV